MSDDANKGIVNILKITPPKEKTPVAIPEEDEDAIDEYFAPTKDENLFRNCP